MSNYTTKTGLDADRKPARRVRNESGIEYLKRDCGWWVTEDGERRNATSAEARYLNDTYGRVIRVSPAVQAHPQTRVM